PAAGLFDGVPPAPPKPDEPLPPAGPDVAVSLERAEAIAQAAELDAQARAEVSESALDALRREVGAKDELLAAADQGREAAAAERDALAAKLAATERALAELKAELELFQTELSATQQRATGAERQLEELQKAKGTLEAETRSLWTEYERLEQELAEARASLSAERELRGRDEGAAAAEHSKLEEQLSALGAELATVRGDLETARREAAEQMALLREAARALERDKALAEKEWREQVEQLRLDGAAREEAIGAVRGQLAQEREARATLASLLEKTQADARTEAERAVSEASALARAELDSVRAQLDALQTRLTEADAVTARLTAERDGARDLVLARERELEVALAQGEAARAEADAARESLARAGADFVARQGALEAQLAEVQKAQELLRQNVQTLQDALERAQVDRRAALEQQERLRTSLDEARTRAQELEGRASQAEQVARAAADRADAAEARTILALPIPERPPLGVKKFGSVDLAGLARLVGQLVLSRAEVRLELAVTGGRRTLWLRNGSVVAAESSFVQESLIDRARRDGLIDARQERDLQPARTASAHEALVILKGRGFLREAEGPPLVQRHTEAVALDALSEAQSEYRLTEEPPGHEVLAARLPRPTLPLLAEAMRRALPAGALLETLGGGEAVPFTADGELDPRALGFGDKERRMLGYVDGEATVEDLTLASGLAPEAAWRALLVAKLLGVIDLKVPEAKSTPPTLELEVQRLADKFEQVQEADYFTVLGLSRSAGTDEVQRAFDRLAEEFDPVRYSGHPDAGLQQRAQVVFHALEEAAQALRDDRRRADYARHLVD
ncbi:MAG: DnaJ domain-containing protein, partial [Myxococcaceae bacterium]|nr:DnaJ domain-containing protein [Myxococcaceae bacterium]